MEYDTSYDTLWAADGTHTNAKHYSAISCTEQRKIKMRNVVKGTLPFL